MKILVIDGQGGGLGKQLVAALSAQCPQAQLTAVGTNSLAASAMRKAGAVRTATGENAVVVNCPAGRDHPRHGCCGVPERGQAGADPGEPLRQLHRRRAGTAHR